MTNLVRRHMESMTEEIEELKRTKLCSQQEIKSLIKKREAYEYKINGVSKKLQDFLAYIEFETILVSQIRSRRNKCKVADKKSSIEYKILRRIKHLYEIAIQRFATEFPLHLEYFRFCSKNSFSGPATVSVQNMIKNFSQKPQVFQIAAAWQGYERKNMTEALSLIYKGISLHPNSPLLYKEAVKLELFNYQLSSQPEEILTQKLEKLFESIFATIKDVNFYAEALELFDKVTSAQSVQKTIVDKLTSEFSSEEATWDTLARREGDNLERCIQIYKDGFAKLESESKQANLWMLFLDCLIAKERSEKVRLALLEALEEAERKGVKLGEKYYVAWMELVQEKEAVEVILENATKSIPQSVQLWKLRLKLSIMNNDPAKLDAVYKAGVEALAELSAPLTIALIDYYSTQNQNDKIRSIFEEAISVSNIMKSKYIEWLGYNFGIHEARKAYRILVNQRPFSRELHDSMARLEEIQEFDDLAAMERVYELACEQFGDTDVDVWLKYVKFGILKLDGGMEKVMMVHRRAEMTLLPHLQADFNESYTNVFSTLEK